MKIFLVERTDTIAIDEYLSMVVCAESAEQARRMLPEKGGWSCAAGFGLSCKLLVDPATLDVTELGTANQGRGKEVILASFNGE